MEVHLIDGTYELFRHYYALPSARDQEGREVAAVRGVLGSILGMTKAGATHVAIATDHVIESFRNDLWPGYKTGDGIPPDLWSQFPLLEEALVAAGFVVWPMVEFEADDSLRHPSLPTLSPWSTNCIVRIINERNSAASGLMPIFELGTRPNVAKRRSPPGSGRK